MEYTNSNTKYFSPESELSDWNETPRSHTSPIETRITLEEVSTLFGANKLLEVLIAAHDAQSQDSQESSGETNTHQSPLPKIGVLNFASAKNPGGGFLGGSRAQEESLARSSTLYPSLTSPTAQPYYKNHRRDPKGGYYSHAMIYSPGVVILKDDDGNWVKERPMEVDILTSPAVNAGVVRRSNKVADTAIEQTMKERMARILFLFEKQGIKNIVLGSFGTGAFGNDVRMVASLWRGLLIEKGGRFERSFEGVIFAVLGRETFNKFEEVFKEGRGGDET